MHGIWILEMKILFIFEFIKQEVEIRNYDKGLHTIWIYLSKVLFIYGFWNEQVVSSNYDGAHIRHDYWWVNSGWYILLILWHSSFSHDEVELNWFGTNNMFFRRENLYFTKLLLWFGDITVILHVIRYCWSSDGCSHYGNDI